MRKVRACGLSAWKIQAKRADTASARRESEPWFALVGKQVAQRFSLASVPQQNHAITGLDHEIAAGPSDRFPVSIDENNQESALTLPFDRFHRHSDRGSVGGGDDGVDVQPKSDQASLELFHPFRSPDKSRGLPIKNQLRDPFRTDMGRQHH